MPEGLPPAVRCSMEILFASEEDAERVHRSVSLDNAGYVSSALKGNAIVAEVEAQTLMSLLHTVDDYLACMSVAQKIVGGDVSPRRRS
jgi:tRNA threonylcarbamoyladenosine modification (KEOPS) complex  Pcc1 subunit